VARGDHSCDRRRQRCVQKALDVHVVLDNASTHKTPEVKAWLARHPRLKMHFTPTSASWLNLVERFFTEITRQRTDSPVTPFSSIEW
jgi:transposase